MTGLDERFSGNADRDGGNELAPRVVLDKFSAVHPFFSFANGRLPAYRGPQGHLTSTSGTLEHWKADILSTMGISEGELRTRDHDH